MRRTQIYLTDSESAALDRQAKKTGLTRSQLIREAIGSKYLKRTEADLVAALLETAGVWKGASRVSGQEYVERRRRGERLSAALARRERG